MRFRSGMMGTALLLALLIGILLSSVILAETTGENGDQAATSVEETTAGTTVETTEAPVVATTAVTTETDPVQTEPEYATVIIRYVDQDSLDIDQSVVREIELGEYTFEAKTIPGFNLISPVFQSVNLSEEGETKEVIFEYQAVPVETESPPTEPDPTPLPTTVPTETIDDEIIDQDPVTELVGIELIFEPLKTFYKTGDDIDIDGLIIHAIYSDGHEEPIQTDELTITGFDSSVPNENLFIFIEYEGHSTGFTVVIEEQEIRSFWNWLFGWPLILLFILFLLSLVAILIILRRKKKKFGVRKPVNAAIGEKIVPPNSRRSRKNTYANENLANNDKSANKNKTPKTPQEKKKRRIRILIIVITIIVALLLLTYAGVIYLLGQMERDDISRDDDELGIDENVGDPKITNIAVFGIDSTDGMQGRSDAIMIITLDEKHDKIKITSIIRDSYVEIPGRGLDKINHAHAFGGPELAIKTINQNFQLDIRHYLSVNFSSMPPIIDAVGGVRVKITDAEANQIRGIDSGGTYTLSGAQALQFARIRRIDSDIERTRRQRDIMESTIRAALNTPVTSYPSMLNNVFPYLTTNLSPNQILNLGRKAVSAGINEIEQQQFPPSSMGSGQRINGTYYYVFDREEGARILSDFIYNDIPIPNE